MIKLLEKILKCYLLEKEINNKWIINFSLLVPFFIIIIVILTLVVLWVFSYDEKFYIMDFFNILDPYILNFWFLFYWWLIWYFISINSKEYIKKITLLIIVFLSVVLVWNYFLKWILENRLYISETSLTKCLVPSISDDINISQLASFRVNESIIWNGLDINLYNNTKKLYYPKKEYIKCWSNNKYCDYYNYEQRNYNELLNEYQEKCIEQNQEKLWNLSWIKIISSGINNKYFPVILLNWIKKEWKLDSWKIKELNYCIDNKNWDIHKCLIDINNQITPNP